MPGLGRLRAVDDRDWQLRRALPTVPLPPRPRPWARFWAALDQGSEGTCVGHGWKNWLLTSPLIQTTPTRSPTAVELYDRATELDEWPGNERMRDFGTSVRAGAKAVQEAGMLNAYAFTTDLGDALAWLDGHGPLVIGVNWYASMMAADDAGYLRIAPGSVVVGGHCVCLDWHDARRGVVAGANSWGPGWGRRGRFRLPLEDFGRLLAEEGEVCTAVEVRAGGLGTSQVNGS